MGARAFLLTWTCHGTWLHGDGRGSVDKRHNWYGAGRLGADAGREERDAVAMVGGGRTLSEEEREVVLGAIEDHCRVRGWDLVAVNVRTNHVHCVVRAAEYRPEIVMGQF